MGIDGALKPEHGDAQVGMTEERADIRSQRMLIKKVGELARTALGFTRLQQRQNMLARHRFNAGEQVGTVFCAR